jgi:hypothetical protein
MTSTVDLVLRAYFRLSHTNKTEVVSSPFTKCDHDDAMEVDDADACIALDSDLIFPLPSGQASPFQRCHFKEYVSILLKESYRDDNRFIDTGTTI